MHDHAPNHLWLLLQPALQHGGDHPAWICRGRDQRRVMTYRQLHRAALAIAAALRARGIGDGDAVAITAPNGAEFTAAALGAWKVGACIAPVHIGNSEHEIAKQMEAIAPAIRLQHESDSAHPSALSIADAMRADEAAIEREAAAPTDAKRDQLAARIYTSGSIGTPKVVRLSHGNLASNLLAARRIETFDARDRFLSLLPLSHAMGLLGTMLLPLHCGAAIVAPKSLAASEILAALGEERISVLIAVPRLFRNVMHGLQRRIDESAALALYCALLKRMPLALRRRLNAPLRRRLGGRITAWVSGGSHLDGRITNFYHDLGLPLRQGYGLTETAPLACIQCAFDHAVESVGRPIEGVRVKIHQPDANGDGEVWIQGPNVMLGYDDEEQTRDALRDGWFQSGDIGRIDADGRLFLTGRSKRLIVTEAGKNVYPEELEMLLERDRAIKEAGVFELDRKPACVLAMNDARADARPALAAFNQLVSPHNRITRFALVDELPRTPLGKIALQQLPTAFAANEVK